ncbi:HD-GYP domain-containing protein [Adhaeretor mobilis]|uniref:Cyclic di-GMP phosphodiesterase response regulator RpfG n=1 Tax=Adhaeretor mobilis TaxID=1930276 RepID=A0A517MSR8_9BACT|nr:HD-GYP domain-containing protein [Adhaeretor mobilis]QDS97909.1 Cyclic di-GMP phosphodiesterase response regulator RpfG [Adhaeretor mobilis]
MPALVPPYPPTAFVPLLSQDILAQESPVDVSAKLGGVRACPARLEVAIRKLERTFDRPFSLVCADTGELVRTSPAILHYDVYNHLSVLKEVAQRGTPEIIEEESPLALLAIPLDSLECGQDYVAVALFVTALVSCETEIAQAAKVFDMDASRALAAVRQIEVWPVRLLTQVAEISLENLTQDLAVSKMRNQRDEAIAHADDTYVELDLLHRITGQLHVAQNEATLWQDALRWLSDSIPAQCLAVVARQAENPGEYELQLGDSVDVLTYGECPIDLNSLIEFTHRLNPKISKRTMVLSRAETSLPTWYYPTVRELICVPLNQADRQQGWLLALNHRGSEQAELKEFGSVESQLLASAGTILSVHSSNLRRFSDQEQLFSSAVHALTSAIDAKDRYTSGHSDRVARVSVCLAEHLGLSKEEIETIYLGGLLHDIGKIGIDDQVLNKPGELTAEEFEHIKQHPQFGYDILKGVRQLDNILPLVLHHHESWDGMGYPHHLRGNEIPLLARIVAVADAYDAMGSDRPYRKGMPVEKLDAILRNGAGQQWDKNVVEAFFAVREEIREISATDPNNVLTGGLAPVSKS